MVVLVVRQQFKHYIALLLKVGFNLFKVILNLLYILFIHLMQQLTH